MTVDPRTDIRDAKELRDLWTGLLLAPIAFLLNLEVAYAMVHRHVLPVPGCRST